MQKIVFLAVWIMTISGFLSSAHAQEIIITLEQRSDELGNTQYLVSLRRLRSFGTQQDVVSPSGSRFAGGHGESMIVSTFEEIQSEIFGLWTVEDFGFGVDEIEIHNFTVEPFDLDSVFSESPLVVSPSDGDTLQPGFVFEWAYAAGVVLPNSKLLSISRWSAHVDIDTTFGDGTYATIDAVFDPGFNSTELTISGGTRETLDGPMSPITSLVDDPRASFTGSLQFRNVTDPITVTIELDYLLGDVNLDGTVTFLDIAPLIALLSSGTFQLEADIDQNGVVDFLDISPFIALLSSQ